MHSLLDIAIGCLCQVRHTLVGSCCSGGSSHYCPHFPPRFTHSLLHAIAPHDASSRLPPCTCHSGISAVKRGVVRAASTRADATLPWSQWVPRTQSPEMRWPSPTTPLPPFPSCSSSSSSSQPSSSGNSAAVQKLQWRWSGDPAACRPRLPGSSSTWGWQQASWHSSSRSSSGGSGSHPLNN